MRDKEFQDQIIACTELLALDPFVIEKDYYLTKVIHALSSFKHPNFNCVFQGGTSLAKAHRIIKRMSEDCDFRVQKITNDPLSKSTQRNQLRDVRKKLIGILNNTELSIAPEDIEIRNEGQLIQIKARYPSQYKVLTTLKPHIRLDFFVGDAKMAIEQKPVTTLIQRTLGDQVKHPTQSIACLSVTETAAEKWVALTRRIATADHHANTYDPSLVRHLYDLYRINQQQPLNHSFFEMTTAMVLHDQEHFKQHNAAYYQDTSKEIKRSLQQLREDRQWKNHWNSFMVEMVYDKDKPTYESALQVLEQYSKKALDHFQQSPLLKN